MDTDNFFANKSTLILPAFWVDDKHFPTEVPIETTLGQVFFEGYDGAANHFGWMDLVQLNLLIKKNNITRLILQNLDTIGRAGFVYGNIIVCNSYKYKQNIIRYVPENDLVSCKPLYSTVSFGGWDFEEDSVEELPLSAMNYLRYILVATKVKEVTYSCTHVSVTAFFDERGLPRFREKYY